MAGQPGQPQYGSGWPDGLLAGLGQPGHREARPLIFGRKFLEIYVVRRQNTPLKFVSTRFWVRLYFVNEKINKIF